MSPILAEFIGTALLVVPVFLMTDAKATIPLAAGTVSKVTIGLGTLGAAPVALLVFGIGLSLGGTTGYAINPARDLGPRLVHAFLPVPGKRDGDWAYARVPVLGPILGGLLAALVQTCLR
jgi:glycerol uptake facilitator protein